MKIPEAGFIGAFNRRDFIFDGGFMSFFYAGALASVKKQMEMVQEGTNIIVLFPVRHQLSSLPPIILITSWRKIENGIQQINIMLGFYFLAIGKR